MEEEDEGGSWISDERFISFLIECGCLLTDSQSDSLLDTLELRLSLFVLELELIGPVLLPIEIFQC